MGWQCSPNNGPFTTSLGNPNDRCVALKSDNGAYVTLKNPDLVYVLEHWTTVLRGWWMEFREFVNSEG